MVYYRHPCFGDIFAYETDGFGNYNLVEDANVLSLLSISYLQYTAKLHEAFDDITVVLKVLLQYRNRLRTTNSVEGLNQKLDVGNG